MNQLFSLLKRQEISQENLHFWLPLEHRGSQPWASVPPGHSRLEWEELPLGGGACALTGPAHTPSVFLFAQGSELQDRP